MNLVAFKGQIISKALLVSSDSPQKRRNDSFLLLQHIMNSIVRFLGEFEDTKKSFRKYLTFNLDIIYSRPTLLHTQRREEICAVKTSSFCKKKACGFLQYTKGQSISKCSFDVFKSPPKNQQFFKDFCPSL